MNAAATAAGVRLAARRSRFGLTAIRTEIARGLRRGAPAVLAALLAGFVALPASANAVQATPLPQPMASALVTNDGYLIVRPLHSRHMSAADLVCAGPNVFGSQETGGIECRDLDTNKPVKPVTVQQALDSEYGAGGATVVSMSPYTYGDAIVYYRINKKQ